MAYKLQEDQNAAARRWYQQNKDKHLAAVARVKVSYKTWFRELKSSPCLDCGGSFDPVCMDFDHRPGELKLFNVADAAKRQLAKAKILEEIAKCDLVCANCHRLRTKDRW